MSKEKAEEILALIKKEVQECIDILDDTEIQLDEMIYQCQTRLRYVKESIEQEEVS